MTATLCELEPAPVSAEKRRANQRELWRRYARSGPGSDLENSMVEEYLPLVRTVVGRLAMTLPSHVNSDDLHSAGLVGLLNALRRYNPDCGTSFETYARVRIRGAVFDELRRMDWVPRSIHEKAKRIERTMQELTQRHGGLPTDQAMAKALNMSLDDYEALLEEIRPTTYLCLDSVQGPDGEHGSGNAACFFFRLARVAGQQARIDGDKRRREDSLAEQSLQEIGNTERGAKGIRGV